MRARKREQVGAVLVFALLILVVGATILGGVAQVAVTQSLAGRTEWDSAARRIRLENSRAMARQYIMSQMWQGSGGLPMASLGTNSTGGLGGFSITSVNQADEYWRSTKRDESKRLNPFNLFERGGFQAAWATGTLSSGTGNVPWGFQIRTRSPITAGFVFVNHLPTNTNSWTPLPRMDMRQTDFAIGFTNLPRMPVSSVTNTSTGDTNGFLGYLSAPLGASQVQGTGTVTGLQTNFFTTDGISYTAEMVVNLQTYDYYNPYGCFAAQVKQVVPNAQGLPNNIPITRLVLEGGSGNYPLRIEVLDKTNLPSNLTNIVLSGDNQRPVYVYHPGSRSLSVSSSAPNTSFRIGMTLFAPATFAPAGSLTIIGGVRTLASAQGNVTFQSEQNADWRYDEVADRMMWLEDQIAR